MIDLDAVPFGAPGCFGRVLAHRPGTPECDVCPFSIDCAPRSAERTRLKRIAAGIAPKEAAMPRTTPKTRTKPAISPEILGMDLPEKVKELLGRFERAGVRVTETLARGENPFPVAPSFMRVVCHVLLLKPQGVSRRYLSAALMHKFGWADTTAMPHATQAVQALCALGAAVEIDGIVALSN